HQPQPEVRAGHPPDARDRRGDACHGQLRLARRTLGSTQLRQDHDLPGHLDMSTAADPTRRAAATWRAGDRWLLGVVLAVITFWLFAQTLLNVIPAIQGSLGLAATVANFAVSITALMSGLFIVVFGGLADHVGRGKILRLGIALSTAGPPTIVLTPAK